MKSKGLCHYGITSKFITKGLQYSYLKNNFSETFALWYFAQGKRQQAFAYLENVINDKTAKPLQKQAAEVIWAREKIADGEIVSSQQILQTVLSETNMPYLKRSTKYTQYIETIEVSYVIQFFPFYTIFYYCCGDVLPITSQISLDTSFLIASYYFFIYLLATKKELIFILLIIFSTFVNYIFLLLCTDKKMLSKEKIFIYNTFY